MHIEASLKNNIEKHTVPADYTMCGPVQLQQDAVDFLGACQHSNNTAEISAIGHALALARTRYQKRPVTICYDSEYAASVARGEWMAHTNEDMAQRIQKLVTQSVNEQDIEWKWVKGHDNIVGNERADGLAKCGTEGRYHNAHADSEWLEFTVAADHTAKNSQVENITTKRFINLCRRSAEEILGRGSPPFSGSPFTMEDRNIAADYKHRLKETWRNIREIPIRTEYHRLNREFRKFKYKANKNTFVRFAQNWKELWKFTMWENSTNSFQNLVYSWKVFHDEDWNLTVCNKLRRISRSWAAILLLLQMRRLSKGYHNCRVITHWIWYRTMQRFFMS